MARAALAFSFLAPSVYSLFAKLQRSSYLLSVEQNCPSPPSLLPLVSTPPAVAQALASINSSTVSLLGTSVPGFALEVLYQGKPLLSTAGGIANTSSGLPFSSRTPSRIASVSKVFQALLLHQLADVGLVQLDGVVGEDCPDFAVINPYGPGGSVVSPPSTAGITWAHLSSHMSGLQREAPALPPGATTQQVLAALAQTMVISPPGSSPSYSNLGFSVLGHLLAECIAPKAPASMALPTTLPALIDTLIVQPLGLQDTLAVVNASVDLTPTWLARMAAGVLADGTIIPQPELDLGWAWPAGGIVSSVADLGTIGATLLAAAGGASTPLNLSQSTAQHMLHTVYRAGDGSYLQGLPWEGRPRGLNISSQTGQDPGIDAGAAPWLVLNKGGNLPGYTALLALVPSLNVTVSVLWNGVIAGGEFGWSDAAMDSLLPPLAQALVDLSTDPAGNTGPRPISTYLGLYPSSVAGGGTVYVLNATLPAQAQVLVYEWIEQGGGRYSFFLDYVGSKPAPSGLFHPSQAAATASIATVDIFRASMPPALLPPGALPCLMDITLGLQGQYVYFGLDAANVSVATAVPGFIPGLEFVKS